MIPTIEFQKDWEVIEKNNVKNLLLFKGPSHFAYFINKGLVYNKPLAIEHSSDNKLLCFGIDSKQKIINRDC